MADPSLLYPTTVAIFPLTTLGRKGAYDLCWSALPSSVEETSSRAGPAAFPIPGDLQRPEVLHQKLPVKSLHGPLGTHFPYISTVHVGAFFLIVSEIILAADSPMGFP